MSKYESQEFYPTPKELLETITEGIEWGAIKYVLEPSAGTGNIAEFVRDKCKNVTTKSGIPIGHDVDIDCIELDADLRSVLTGKGFRVIHDDFKTYHGFKNYDLILMNPPFSEGAAHLKKALTLLKPGSALVCILNAETLKNPYSNERQELRRTLEELNAIVEYKQSAFAHAERTTDVEIAVVKVIMGEEERENDFLFEYLGKKTYAEHDAPEETSLATDDYISNAVMMYQMETEAGIKLIRDYKKLRPHLESCIGTANYHVGGPMLELKCDGSDLTENAYVRKVREKYWNALFKNPKFTGNMTSNLKEEYSSKVKELCEYDFTTFNIRHLQIEMSKELVGGIEDCIIKLFDKLSFQYSYSDELSKNIHYYNGWKTNKSWYINSKVILPGMNAWDYIFKSYRPTDYRLMEQLQDIESALNYLDGGRTTDDLGLYERLKEAEKEGITKDIDTKFLKVTFYKKGTCHIVFKDEELLKKLNIFGSQKKGWLPQGYGKRAYHEFNEEEQEVIKEFDGSEIAYQKTLHNSDFLICDTSDIPPRLTA